MNSSAQRARPAAVRFGLSASPRLMPREETSTTALGSPRGCTVSRPDAFPIGKDIASMRPFVIPHRGARAGRLDAIRRPARSALPCEVIGEIGEVLVLERLDHRGHGGIVAGTLRGLVRAQRLQQIVLALCRKTRDLILAGERRGVTEVAPVRRDQGL